ncbi:MAG TPA: PilZ domain-containing protein [Polyangiaceae bacterium]
MGTQESSRVGHFRAHARRKVNLHAQVSHGAAGWERSLRVLDLALGGACLEVLDAVAPGDRLEVSFVTPDRWDPLVLRARVIWMAISRGAELGRAGLVFEHSDPSQALGLLTLLCSQDYEE